MALPLPLSGAFNLFSQRVIVYDVEKSLVNGRPVSLQYPDRMIVAVIQPKMALKIDLTKYGALSDGDMLLNTKNAVSAYDRSHNLVTGLQTYCRYEGEIWKLNTLGYLEDKSGYDWYLLIKYTDIGNT